MIILDLGLPDGDGLDLLREWRRWGFHEPVIILSARDSLDDRINGLNLGADDYLPKPFSFEELLARTRSPASPFQQNKTDDSRASGHSNDLLGHTVSYKNEPIDLTNREYALLEALLQNKGRVLTRTQIGEKIWEA